MVRLVPPKGPEDSKFVFVGEAPGSEEVKQGIPFVGPSGRIFQAAISQKGTLPFPEPYITNVIKHKIGSGLKPNEHHDLIQENLEEFTAEITKHPRRLIVAMGNIATWALTGDYNKKITRVRGTIFPSPFAEMGILCTVHPAYLLRGGGSFRQYKADIFYAMRIASGLPPYIYTPPTYKAMTTPADIEELYQLLLQLPPDSVVSADLETTGFSPIECSILSGGLTFDGKHIFTFWGSKTDRPAHWNVLAHENMLAHIKKLFEIPHLKYNWHNGKFDIKFLRNIGIKARVDHDTMLMSYTLDETRGVHDLETVAGDWLYSPNWKGELDKHKKKKATYDVIPADVLERYMAFDIANTHNLVPMMLPNIEGDAACSRQYYKSLIPMSEWLAHVETRGLYADQERVAQNAASFGKQADELGLKLMMIGNMATAGRYTDKLPNSPLQLAELLYDDLKIFNPTKIRSTSDDILEKLPPHDAVLTLRTYRKIAKALSTYVTPYTKAYLDDGLIQSDGKVHTTFLIHGTATGRLSSREPNLQNIPRDPQLRGTFVAAPGRAFVEPDLNQAELRSLAALSEDPDLCAVYEDPKSKGLHEITRAAIYGLPGDWDDKRLAFYLQKWFLTPETRYTKDESGKIIEDRLMKEQKMRSKNVNFGIVYGITAGGLSEQINDTRQEAQRMLDAWAIRFPVAWKFIQTCRASPLYHRNLVTVFGYRKRHHIVAENNYTSLQNEAANFPHQSTASLITNHAAMRTYQQLEEMDCYFVNTVHDSLLLDTPRDPIIMDTAAKIVMNELEAVPRDWGITRIPFKAEAGFGLRWGSLGDQDEFYESQGWEMPLAA